jgi:hypothetical protein
LARSLICTVELVRRSWAGNEGSTSRAAIDEDARYSLQKVHIAAAIIDHAHVIKVVANGSAGQRHQQWLIKQPGGGDGKSHNAGDVVRCERDRHGSAAARMIMKMMVSTSTACTRLVKRT